ncbi:MAG: FAD-binding oxidoreductase [Pseudomonadota bacterium]
MTKSQGSERVHGWGRFPVVETHVERPRTLSTLTRSVDAADSMIVRGNGRSYGDASLHRDRVIETTRLDRMIAIDEASGQVIAEAGVLLSDLLDTFLDRGWFPPVTPGSKFVTLGGMVASDVHGKNHHGAGSFCDHVDWIDLATGDGKVLRCSADQNSELFAATCGGMGLTGAILTVAFRMKPVETAMVRQKTVRAPSLSHALDIFERSHDWTYSVAWIDCLASGNKLGRSAIMLGEHARIDELPVERRKTPLRRPARKAKSVPFDFPSVALSRPSVAAFNRLYYMAQRPGERLVDIDPYFYPLDSIHDWNRIYGKRGFAQFQCVLPLESSQEALETMLTLLSKRGQASFLAVLKRLGAESFGLLSFPRPGYTLALDFPATAENLSVVNELDAITADHGGRIYLAKDACAQPQSLEAGYPRLDQFRKVREAHGLDKRTGSLLSERLAI